MKKITFKGVWKLLKDASSGFIEDKILKLSASLAYYTVFSLGPMIIVIIFLCNIFWGKEAVEGSIYGQIRGFVGGAAALQIQDIIRSASLSGKSKLAATVGIVTLVVGATTMFAEIQDSINMIWGLKTKPGAGFVKLLLTRLLSFSVIVTMGFLLLVSLVINALIEGFMTHLQHMFPHLAVIFVYIFNLILTFAVTTSLFAIIFRMLPDAKIKWKEVFVGAMYTAFLFMIGKFAITFYIGSTKVGSTYGTAGSFVVILLWVYYSSVILYFGAEFTKAFACSYGHRIHPNQYAVWIRQVEVEEGKISLQQKEEKVKEQTVEDSDETVKKDDRKNNT